jgi:uncharacterized membrane protein YqgA involved in biofilm formation
MDISIWAKTSGTWVNAASVLVGTLVGLGLRRNFSPAMQQTLQHGVDLVTLVLGMSMAASLPQVKAGSIDGVMLGLAALALGGVLGEWLQFDEQLARLGRLLSAWSGKTDSGIEGMVGSFCCFALGR